MNMPNQNDKAGWAALDIDPALLGAHVCKRHQAGTATCHVNDRCPCAPCTIASYFQDWVRRRVDDMAAKHGAWVKEHYKVKSTTLSDCIDAVDTLLGPPPPDSRWFDLWEERIAWSRKWLGRRAPATMPPPIEVSLDRLAEAVANPNGVGIETVPAAPQPKPDWSKLTTPIETTEADVAWEKVIGKRADDDVIELLDEAARLLLDAYPHVQHDGHEAWDGDVKAWHQLYTETKGEFSR